MYHPVLLRCKVIKRLAKERFLTTFMEMTLTFKFKTINEDNPYNNEVA